MQRLDFNEAVRQEAYGRNQRGREPMNRRDAARMVSRYQELSRNPSMRNIRAAARLYNSLEQNNYHKELRSARRGASSRDVSNILERERLQRNRRQNELRREQRAARAMQRSGNRVAGGRYMPLSARISGALGTNVARNSGGGAKATGGAG